MRPIQPRRLLPDSRRGEATLLLVRRTPIACFLSAGICIAAFNCTWEGCEVEGCVRSRTRYIIDNGSFGRQCGFAVRINLINGKVSQRVPSVRCLPQMSRSILMSLVPAMR